MLERAALRARKRTHAYLVLLRIEVAAFHPAALVCKQTMRHGVTVAVWLSPPSRQTRLCGPIPQRTSAPDGR
jgi:hypothetical protein